MTRTHLHHHIQRMRLALLSLHPNLLRTVVEGRFLGRKYVKAGLAGNSGERGYAPTVAWMPRGKSQPTAFVHLPPPPPTAGKADPP